MSAYTPISTELTDGAFLAAQRTHNGRGDPCAGGHARRLSSAPERVPWGFIVSAAVVLAVVVGVLTRL